MSLKGKSAIVTGSTSGIGLAVAYAFAAEGCNIMLNGFGDSGAIARQREDMAKQFGVKVEYNAADMSKPAEIADLVNKTKVAFAASTSWSTTPASSSPRRSRIFRPRSGTPSSPST